MSVRSKMRAKIRTMGKPASGWSFILHAIHVSEKTTTGPPTETAQAGSLVLNSFDGDDIYINSDGAVGWLKIID